MIFHYSILFIFDRPQKFIQFSLNQHHYYFIVIIRKISHSIVQNCPQNNIFDCQQISKFVRKYITETVLLTAVTICFCVALLSIRQSINKMDESRPEKYAHGTYDSNYKMISVTTKRHHGRLSHSHQYNKLNPLNMDWRMRVSPLHPTPLICLCKDIGAGRPCHTLIDLHVPV